MAIAYAALGNGGTIVTPHVGKEIDDSAGRVLREFDPAPQRQVRIDPAYRAAIMEGLHDAAQGGGGTSYDVFGGFPIEVAGKTGTAQRPPYEDQSWYAVLAPYPNPKIVTVVTFEEGGFGADTAAPRPRSDPRSVFRQAADALEADEGSREEEGTARMNVATRSRRARPECSRCSPGSPSGSAFPTWTAALALRGDRAGRR